MIWPFSKKAALSASTVMPETKSLGDPTAELLELFGAIPSGTTISNADALSVPAVSCAVRLVSEAVASTPVKLKRKVGDTETDVEDHPALTLLTRQANNWTSGYELLRDLVAQALTEDSGGKAYVVKVGDQPREIIRYQSSYLQVDYDQASGEPKYRLDNRPIAPGAVIHVRGPFSKSPLSMARDAIAIAKAMESYANSLWTNGARPGGVITTPEKVGDTGMKAMLAGWKAAFGGSSNSGKTAVLYGGATFAAMAMTSVDGQFNESRTFQVNEVARAFRTPPAMLYEMGRATWSNSEQAGKEFITYCLIPWLRAVESALNRALLTPAEMAEYRFAFDVDDISQADLTARATAISTLITAKVLNPNEAREWLDMPPRAGGDEFSNPAIDVTKPANQNKPQEDALATDKTQF